MKGFILPDRHCGFAGNDIGDNLGSVNIYYKPKFVLGSLTVQKNYLHQNQPQVNCLAFLTALCSFLFSRPALFDTLHLQRFQE
jgi:hypothetical protein